MITELTAEQNARLDTFYKESLAIGRNCAPLDVEEAADVVKEIYRHGGHSEPAILVLGSPAMCLLAWALMRQVSPPASTKTRLDHPLPPLPTELHHSQVVWESLWKQSQEEVPVKLLLQLWNRLGERLLRRCCALGLSLREQLQTAAIEPLQDQLQTSLNRLQASLLGLVANQRAILGRSGKMLPMREQLLWKPLWDQVHEQLEGRVWAQLSEQMGGEWKQQLGDFFGEMMTGEWKQQLGNYFGGQHWLYWTCFYKFCADIGVKYTPQQMKLLNLWIREAKALHWWFPYDGVVLLSERHSILKLDAQERLHSESGQACGYPDGWGVWAWHGVRVAEHVITHPEKITVAEIHAEQNSQVRAVLIERYGFERYMLDAQAKELDREGEYRLVTLSDPTFGQMRALKMTCPSTGAVYVHGVDPQCCTVQQALAWKRGDDLHNHKFARHGDVYLIDLQEKTKSTNYGDNLLWES